MTPKPTILSRHKLTTSIATGATVIVLATGGYAIANSGSGSRTAHATTAKSGPGNIRATCVGSWRRIQCSVWTGRGGASGTVDSVSTPSFTISTSAGQKVTVNKASSTTYRNGTSATSARAVTKGANVLVLGVQRNDHHGQPGHRETERGRIRDFRRGRRRPLPAWRPSTVRQAGQIPTNYSQGSGTIVSGTAANRSTDAALSAYPGGIVDRVVKLSNGEYEVHYIGVNWPHHIFVNQDYKVVGAN